MNDAEFEEKNKLSDALWEKVKTAKAACMEAERAWLEVYQEVNRERSKRSLLAELKGEGRL